MAGCGDDTPAAERVRGAVAGKDSVAVTMKGMPSGKARALLRADGADVEAEVLAGRFTKYVTVGGDTYGRLPVPVDGRSWKRLTGADADGVPDLLGPLDDLAEAELVKAGDEKDGVTTYRLVLPAGKGNGTLSVGEDWLPREATMVRTEGGFQLPVTYTYEWGAPVSVTAPSESDVVPS